MAGLTPPPKKANATLTPYGPVSDWLSLWRNGRLRTTPDFKSVDDDYNNENSL